MNPYLDILFLTLLMVFIVDLWHPNVAGAERQALDFVFAPDP